MSVFPAWRDLASWLAASERMDDAGDLDDAHLAGGMHGRCRLCGSAAGFEWNPAASPRENFACRDCRCIGRHRAAGALLLARLGSPHRAVVFATERTSDFFAALRPRVGRLLGSEFVPSLARRLRLSLWLLQQGRPGWVRHGDLTALRFADASLDGVVSQDVLEHVHDHRRALREVARVLRPGAPFVFTVPFYDLAAESVRIADIDGDGRILHHGPPEYHGDPVSGGALCFHHFGWSLLEDLREAGFADAEACRVRDPEAGLPAPVWVFSATR